MNTRILCAGASLMLLPLCLHADEGMWMLPLLKEQQLARMQELGLKLQDYDIYHPDSASLKDAVVIFDGGCTGEMISSDGLVLTNHHCGYGYIQQHSSTEHDYLTDGYWAMSREEELPSPGLSVTFIEKIEDVTDYVFSRLEADDDPTGLRFLSPTYLNGLAKEKAGKEYLDGHPGTEVEIRAFYGGNQYVMFTKKKYSDIRLVGAPPSSVGKFGADTDNWMWPRHTGDFSLFRVYADAAGNPAEYAESNVPLRPKRWLKISLAGIEENGFAMMIGFPGRTNTYYTSWEVIERRDIDNAVRIRIRGLRQQTMLEEMLKDPAIRIRYADKYAGSVNAHKNAEGMNWAIRTRRLDQEKQAVQDSLTAWSQQTDRPEYPEALRMLEQIVHDRRNLRFRSWMLDEALLRGIECTGVPVDVKPVIDALKGKDRKQQQEQIRLLTLAWHRFLRSGYSHEVDRKIAKVMLKEYCRTVPAHDRPSCFSVIERKFRGDTDRFIDHLFRTSIYGSPENFNTFIAAPSAEALKKDPMIQFAKGVQQEKASLVSALAEFDAAYASEHREYVKGLLEMNSGLHFPDANSTIRLTYGQKTGYTPRDAVRYLSRTTLDGVMEKEEPGNREFEVPARLKELYRTQDFGPYRSREDGKMPVAFCLNTHTTGGNSGSPVLNALGELTGINFDRNWEGVGGDIRYLPDCQRSIAVDIRYVLFIIDKYAGAGYLLKEMEIVPE
ncbi:MAG: S46 family peptidase [Tannerellaceae bacterium]|nr:S46 family peptidase [Tannerellaceae bacterium]